MLCSFWHTVVLSKPYYFKHQVVLILVIWHLGRRLSLFKYMTERLHSMDLHTSPEDFQSAPSPVVWAPSIWWWVASLPLTEKLKGLCLRNVNRQILSNTKKSCFLKKVPSVVLDEKKRRRKADLPREKLFLYVSHEIFHSFTLCIDEEGHPCPQVRFVIKRKWAHVLISPQFLNFFALQDFFEPSIHNLCVTKDYNKTADYRIDRM